MAEPGATALSATGAAVTVAGLAVLGVVAGSRWQADATRRERAAGLEAAIAAAPAVRPAPDYSWERFAPPLVASGEAVVRLQVPAVGLDTVVVEGVGDDELDVAAGHDPRTVYPGVADNSVVSGHRDRQFAALAGIEPGDEVVTVAPYGTWRWTVTGTRIVGKDDPSIIGPSRPSARLTLTTCYPFDWWGRAPDRFVVTAELAPGQLPYGGEAGGP